MTRTRAHLASVSALVACVLWINWGLISTPGHLTAHWDNLDGGNPLRIEAARQWTSGHIPLWNPYKRVGMPLLADTTAAAIYPGNFPFLLSLWRTPFGAMDAVALLHFLIASAAMYGFLRIRGASAAACTIGGLVYACNGTMLWLASYYIQMQNSMAWLPVVMLALHAAATRAKCFRWLGLGASAVALQFFAGYPEYSFYTALLAIAYAFALARAVRQQGAPYYRPLLAVIGIYGFGLALAAVHLLPSVELQLLSRRPLALGLSQFQSIPVPISMPLSWSIPAIRSAFVGTLPPSGAYHVGAATVVLLMFAAFRAGSGRGLFFWCTLVIGYLLAIGPATPISGWAYHVPGLSAFRHPFKHLLEINFAIAALAAIGFDGVATTKPTAARTIAVAAMVAVAALCAFPSGGAAVASWGDGSLVLLWSVVIPTAVMAGAIVSRYRLLALAAVLASLAIPYRINERAFAAGVLPEAAEAGARPAIADVMEPGWRVAVRRLYQARNAGILLGDYPTQFEIFGLNGAGPYLWRPLADATGMVEEEITFRPGIFAPPDLTLSVLSCRYVVATWLVDRYLPVFDPGLYTTVFETPEVRVAERKDTYPRFRLVDTVRCATQPTIDFAIQKGALDLRDLALIDCAEGYTPPTGLASSADARIESVTERPGRIELSASVPRGEKSFLVVSQADYPGWRAYVDDHEVPIRRTYGLIQGVELGGGRSRVVLEYAPRSFLVGAAVSALTTLLLIGLCIRERRGRRPHELLVTNADDAEPARPISAPSQPESA